MYYTPNKLFVQIIVTSSLIISVTNVALLAGIFSN